MNKFTMQLKLNSKCDVRRESQKCDPTAVTTSLVDFLNYSPTEKVRLFKILHFSLYPFGHSSDKVLDGKIIIFFHLSLVNIFSEFHGAFRDVIFNG